MDRLDVYPLGPDPIPQPTEKPVYTIKDGRLRGPGVFYAPTSWKTYRRPAWCGGRPLVGVLHYTAVLADTRPLTDLEKLLRKASIEYEALEELRDTVGFYGLIPDSLALTLQNAGRQRKASWCLCIGREEIPGEGLTYVTQYSPDFRTHGTMHAGPGKLWKWRKRYRGKEILTQDGDVRWDGRKARAPVVTDAQGEERVIWTPNPPGIGIEVMNVGPLGLGRLLRHPSWRKLPRVKVGSRHYHKPSPAILRTVLEVLRALHREYAIKPCLVGRHADYTPTKIDPQPPFDVERLRARL